MRNASWPDFNISPQVLISCEMKDQVILDIKNFQITTFIKVCVAFVFGVQTLELKDFSKTFMNVVI